MAKPFLVVPWSGPFIPALLDIALEATGGDIGSACFVFPHSRPALYLTEAIRTDPRIPKPCVMPRTESLAAFMSGAHGFVAGRMKPTAGLLDRVALLLEAVRDLRGDRPGTLDQLPLDDSRRFFPWGVRLANLMEELLAHNRRPADLHCMEDEVVPFAAALLANLGAIYERYLAGITARGWTTPGLDSAAVAAALADGQGLESMPSLAGRTLILAGFHTLTGAEDIVFRHLWTAGATVCLHADPAVVSGSPHWSCEQLVRWAESWRASLALAERKTAASDQHAPDIRFRGAFDVHSQLGDLAEELRAPVPSGPRTAIVLPDTNLLLPVLHHLPGTDVNISMGYPLARSPLFRLIETILLLQERRTGSGPHGYHWKGLIDLLRHPYLKMLDPAPGDAPEDQSLAAPFRRLLHHAERAVRTGRRFARVSVLLDEAAAAFEAAEGSPPDPLLTALLARIVDTMILRWESVGNTGDLAAVLDCLGGLMRDHGGSLWSRFPIDAECLYRMTMSLVPQLAHTAFRDEALAQETLFALLRQLLAQERVPFEAYPLVGDQILGMLETRLLDFDRVFILDLTDDQVPGGGAVDPLLPDALRGLAGLPSGRSRERIAAYNFFRLIRGARQATLYWQEGVEARGQDEAKKRRSRFVEELLWNEEQRLGRPLAPEKAENSGRDGPFRLVSCLLPSVRRARLAPPAAPSVREAVNTLLRKEISPSLLDGYLQCPARFFLHRLGRIREVEAVNEGRDAVGTGVLLHDMLRRYFGERLNRPVSCGEKERAAMRDLFRLVLDGGTLGPALGADDRIMLEEAAPHVLGTLLERHAGRIPVQVEEKYSAPLTVDGLAVTLGGIIDRVDEDGGQLLVVDYKSGHLPAVDTGVWHDEEFWRTLEAWRPGDEDILPTVADRFQSVQLPAYVYLAATATGRDSLDAAYVPLKLGAKDAPLFGTIVEPGLRPGLVRHNIPVLLAFLVRHMAGTAAFGPRPGQHCQWCLYSNACIVCAG